MTTSLKPVGLGIIGCGKISQAYFDGAKTFEILKVVGCADLNPAVSQAQAKANGCEAMSVDELLAHPEIELVINLTIPAAHAEVSRKILEAGKHSYCEKPITVDLEDAQELLALAKEKDLLVGSAPDTFLGGGIQTCRQIIDSGALGRIVSGTAFMMGRGPESWHPNPGFYYLKGGGPVLDMAPYYLTALINLIGPVASVQAHTSKAFETRIATCKEHNGEELPVEVSTHCSAILEFVSGAVITAVFSFDVPKHGHSPIELYGTKGSLKVPDPNTFGGPVQQYLLDYEEKEWKDVELTFGYDSNMRSIGAADMAYAIRTDRPYRANGDVATHVLEVMHAFEKSSDSQQAVTISSRPERPKALPEGLVEGLLDES
ncbi:Gfo/Idh/MocA family protein [Puniceicoccus vermicola]|uniref:Gfo/Idh/MocA family oxidoreductase n=1 Tax=Puniceicoccus vermicola TaxID=388746 RepID=A0A7X1B4G6_9BACT|nr:Gfo/Idh/MocA family oxidoreductase [Puniceicoccus vermicola]MBC2604333.1 Gfo/Idh/MocA family oxidoreductase [Puniceicoccus vermicola]